MMPHEDHGSAPHIIRVTRSKAEARTAYSRMSRWYHLLIDPFERRYRLIGLRLLAAREGEQVLGVGFGLEPEKACVCWQKLLDHQGR